MRVTGRRVLSGRSLVTVLAAVAACSLAAGATVSALQGGEHDRLESLVQRVTESGAPGVLLLVRDGETSRATARGTASLDTNRPIRADDRFRIGSITKTFVATVVLQLVAEGGLELSDTVEEWLPGVLPARARTVTVQQLLMHTSGLYDYVDDPRVFAPYAQEPGHDWAPDRLVRIALEHPVLFDAGRRYAYSSTNYLLLGLIVEAATGRRLADELQARIFGPLALERTTFSARFVPEPFIHGHRPPSHQGVVTGAPRDTSGEAASWAWAAGAIASSARDVTRFFGALLAGDLLRPNLVRQMETVAPAGSLRYGLGLAAFPTRCGDAWGHTGNAQGTVTVAWNRRDASRQVVLVVNVYPLSPELEQAVRDLQVAAFCSEG